MGSSRDLMDEDDLYTAMEVDNDVVDDAACRGTPYTNPKEWSWDAASHAWIHDDGTRMSHFTPTGQAAIVSGGRLMGPTTSNVIGPLPYPYPHSQASISATGAIGPPSYQPINPHGVPTERFTIASPGPSEFAISTSHGQVKINLDTGDLTFPPGIGRDVAVREFWLGFHEHFKTIDKKKYEQQIAEISRKADEYRNHANDVVKKSILKKITEKYGNEKFIMIKPADLIKMIEGA